MTNNKFKPKRPKQRSLLYENIEACRQTCPDDCPGQVGIGRLDADRAYLHPNDHFPEWERKLRYGSTYEQLIHLRAIKDIKALGWTVEVYDRRRKNRIAFRYGNRPGESGQAQITIATDNPLQPTAKTGTGVIDLASVNSHLKADRDQSSKTDIDLVYVGGPGIWLLRTDAWPSAGPLRLVWPEPIVARSPLNSRPGDWPQIDTWPIDDSNPSRRIGCWLMTIETNPAPPTLIRPKNRPRQVWEKHFSSHYCLAAAGAAVGDYIMDSWSPPGRLTTSD